jgi:hypothetical protein
VLKLPRGVTKDSATAAQIETGSAAVLRYPVQVVIRGLGQPQRGVFAVRAPRLGAKRMERGQQAMRCDLERCAVVMFPTEVGCPVEVAVGSLKQPRERVPAVRTGSPAVLAEVVERGKRSVRSELEDGPAAIAVAACAAKLGGPVKVQVGRLNQPGGIFPIRAST